MPEGDWVAPHAIPIRGPVHVAVGELCALHPAQSTVSPPPSILSAVDGNAGARTLSLVRASRLMGSPPGRLAAAHERDEAVLDALQRAVRGRLRQQQHRRREADDHAAQDAADARDHDLQVTCRSARPVSSPTLHVMFMLVSCAQRHSARTAAARQHADAAADHPTVPAWRRPASLGKPTAPTPQVARLVGLHIPCTSGCSMLVLSAKSGAHRGARAPRTVWEPKATKRKVKL